MSLPLRLCCLIGLCVLGASLVPAEVATPETETKPGYKGLAWGATLEQAQRTIVGRLVPVKSIDCGPWCPADGYLRFLLYHIWGVPDDTFPPTGQCQYAVEVVPQRFSIFRAADYDFYLFYEGRFWGYYAQLNPEGHKGLYQEYLTHLSQRYGKPQTRVLSFCHQAYPPTGPFVYEMNTWHSHGTIVRLVRETGDSVPLAQGTWAFYTSAAAEQSISAVIRESIARTRRQKTSKMQERKRRDLEKLP